jgi:hypothetical protein
MSDFFEWLAGAQAAAEAPDEHHVNQQPIDWDALDARALARAAANVAASPPSRAWIEVPEQDLTLPVAQGDEGVCYAEGCPAWAAIICDCGRLACDAHSRSWDGRCSICCSGVGPTPEEATMCYAQGCTEMARVVCMDCDNPACDEHSTQQGWAAICERCHEHLARQWDCPLCVSARQMFGCDMTSMVRGCACCFALQEIGSVPPGAIVYQRWV